MRSFKAVLLSIIVIVLVIVVVQNLDLLMDQKTVRLNLLVWSDEGPPIPLAVFFLGFFLIGLLLSYICGLNERFKAKKAIQKHLETIRKTEEEIKVLKAMPFGEEEQASSSDDSKNA